MPGLGELVRGLAAREGVQAAVLVSGDGLPIEHAASSAVEPETIAALGATLAQHAKRLGEGAARGELHTAVLEYEGGLLLLARAGGGGWLALLAHSGADIGTLLYDLRQHRPALAQLL
jgi:predicted regulator of Ras-like GTPase activity (Roadblock/LC7/MglB family)